MRFLQPLLRGLVLVALVPAGAAHAAEGFQVRYNLAGTLGLELFSPTDLQGWVAGVVRSDARLDKITGPGGGPLSLRLPGGTLPAPGALNPTYPATSVSVATTGRLAQYNLQLARIWPAGAADERWVVGLNLPYAASKWQRTGLSGPTPALAFDPSVGPAARAAATAAFNSLYQGQLAALATQESTEVQGVGDLELQAAWMHRTASLRLLAGGSLVVPTGAYDPAPGTDVSLGNFHTLRPVVQAVWLPTPDVSLGGRLTYGVSTRNHDSGVRSGNWLALETAAGGLTRWGSLGLQGLLVHQVQDDSGGPWGGNRLHAAHLGLFYATRIPAVDTALSLNYMATTDSRNARHGRYLQLRLVKAF